MKKNVFGKAEKILTVIFLAIIYIICIAKFFYTLMNHSDLISLFKSMDKSFPTSFYSLIKVVSIVCICITIVLFFLSFISVLIKNTLAKKIILISTLTFTFLVVVFFLILRISNGNMYSVKSFNSDNFYNYYEYYEVRYAALINMLYVVCCALISCVMCFITISLNTTQNTHEDKKEETSEEEEALHQEIKKLKDKIRIKSLEEEYFKLKSH